MVDRTYLPFWRVSIAAHIQSPEQRAEYLDAEIARAPSERVRARIVALKHRTLAGRTREEGSVVALTRPGSDSSPPKRTASRG